MRPSAYSTSPEVLATIPRPLASCVGICRNPVKPVSMTASKTLTGGDASLALEMEIVTTGLPLVSNDPTTFGIRRAARAVGTWIPDSHQVVRPILGRFNGLPVHRLRRVTEEKLFRCDVDEDVLSVVSRLKLGSMPLIELPSDARDFLDAECHLTSTLA